MAISFEVPERVVQEQQMAMALAQGVMRPQARRLDEDEHARPGDFLQGVFAHGDLPSLSIRCWSR